MTAFWPTLSLNIKLTKFVIVIGGRTGEPYPLECGILTLNLRALHRKNEAISWWCLPPPPLAGAVPLPVFVIRFKLFTKASHNIHIVFTFTRRAKIQGRSAAAGSGISTDTGSWVGMTFCRRIQCILDLVLTVFARSCGSWILLREN